MAEQPIDKNQIIKDGTIENVIKQFKDWENQLKKTNKELLEIARNTVIKPVVNTEDFAKLLSKVEKLEALYKKQSETTKQLTTIERERLKLTKATETAEAKKIIAINKENKALIELQQETNKANKAQRDAIKVSERQKNAYSKLSDETTKYKNESKRLGAELLKLEDDGKKLSKEWLKLSKAYDKATLSAQKGDEQLKKLDKRVGDNQRKVGLYENATRRLSSALGALGIAFGIGQLKTFASDLIEINSQSKGVQFAFDRLGLRGVNAFDRIKKSTRGLLSDLEIKKSINEFKNFNLSLEQSDVLFEFLSVRATQTGKSVDSLRDSLVEGLSKESKLRIDNLGISTKDLNDELERTPSFIDAVANIAKRELVKAGDILDTAGSAQERWNAQILNTKERLGKELEPIFETVFKNGAEAMKFVAENMTTILKLVGLSIKAFIVYKTVTLSSALANRVLSISFIRLGRSIGGLKGILKGVSGAFKSLGNALKANAVGIALVVVTALYSAYQNLEKQINVTNEAQKRLNKANVEAEKSIISQRRELETLLVVARDENRTKEERLKAIKAINEISPEQLGNLNLENVAKQEGVRITDLYVASLLKEAKVKAITAQIDKLGAELIDNENRKLKERIGFVDQLLATAKFELATKLGIGNADKAISDLADKGIENEFKTRKELEAQALILQEQLNTLIDMDALGGPGDGTGGSGGSNANKEKDLSSLIRRTEDLRIQALKDEEEREVTATSTKFERELKSIEGNSKIENDLRIQLEINLQIELSKIRDKFRLQEANSKQEVYDSDAKKQEALNNELKTSFQKQEADAARILIAERKDRRKAEEIERKQEADKLKETYTNVLNTVSNTYTALNTMVSDSIDIAIEGQNRLISNSQRTIDLIKQSAIAGNEQAKESILAEEKAIEESQKRIEKAQKRKQRMELISTGINTFNQKVASGTGGLQALGETGAQMAGLIGLLNALPSFFIGADRLSSDGSPIDSKGGFLAINHPDERIVPASKNKMIGFDTSNEKLANIMSYYNKGLLVPAGQVGVVQVPNDNSEVLKSINDGFSKINNYNISVEELFGQISVIIEQKRDGNVYMSKKTFK